MFCCIIPCWLSKIQKRGRELSDDFYDVIVVGAGPAGSYAAYDLASRGHNVAVFEEKRAPGLDVCCTGIISTACFDSVGVGPEVILARSNSARFFSPSGRHLRLQTEETLAYVVDRSSFDAAIAAKAEAQGAQYLCSSQVTCIAPGKDRVQVEAQCSGIKELFAARTVILACGCRPRLSQMLGLGRIRRFFVGAQAELEARDVDEVEVHFGRETAPGSFAWLVPISEDRAYAGLLATSYARQHLGRFIQNLVRGNRARQKDVEIRQKAIPLGTPTRTYGDRVLLIGDSAGQVKPTTGGGIYFGNLGARIAAEVLDEALRDDDLSARRLARYEQRWKALMGGELARGYLARWAYARLSDRQIERMFAIMESTGAAEALLRSSEFSFDWHGRLVLSGLRRSAVYPWLRLRHFFVGDAGT